FLILLNSTSIITFNKKIKPLFLQSGFSIEIHKKMMYNVFCDIFYEGIFTYGFKRTASAD
ncbi:MAG: hypothetical protein IJ330_03950, partial [Oscillospiraceae bacterium]|nr:hypothetical protein [Oscillospiraceae bacterium]